MGLVKRFDHEWEIGMYTNLFRAICPNFALVLGKFDCTGSWSNVGSSVKGLSICGSKGEGTPYLIYEAVKQPTQLYDWLIDNALKYENYTKTLHTLYQSMAALSLAEGIGWRHNDEHMMNLLVSPLDSVSGTLQTDIFTYILTDKST